MKATDGKTQCATRDGNDLIWFGLVFDQTKIITNNKIIQNFKQTNTVTNTSCLLNSCFQFQRREGESQRESWEGGREALGFDAPQLSTSDVIGITHRYLRRYDAVLFDFWCGYHMKPKSKTDSRFFEIKTKTTIKNDTNRFNTVQAINNSGEIAIPMCHTPPLQGGLHFPRARSSFPLFLSLFVLFNEYFYFHFCRKKILRKYQKTPPKYC